MPPFGISASQIARDIPGAVSIDPATGTYSYGAPKAEQPAPDTAALAKAAPEQKGLMDLAATVGDASLKSPTLAASVSPYIHQFNTNIGNIAKGGKPPTSSQIAGAVPLVDKGMLGDSILEAAGRGELKSVLDSDRNRNVLGQIMDKGLQGAGVGKGQAIALTSATQDLLQQPEGQYLFAGTNDPAQVAAIANSKWVHRAFDAAADAYSSTPGTSADTGSSAAFGKFLDKFEPASKKAIIHGYYEGVKGSVNGLRSKLAEAKTPEAQKAIQSQIDVHTGRFANLIRKSTGIAVEPKGVLAMFEQPKENNNFLQAIVEDKFSTGKSITQATWDAVKSNPFGAIKSFLGSPESRSLMWDFVKGYAGQNPGTAALAGGVALIGVMAVGMMAMNMLGGSGGSRREED